MKQSFLLPKKWRTDIHRYFSWILWYWVKISNVKFEKKLWIKIEDDYHFHSGWKEIYMVVDWKIDILVEWKKVRLTKDACILIEEWEKHMLLEPNEDVDIFVVRLWYLEWDKHIAE